MRTRIACGVRVLPVQSIRHAASSMTRQARNPDGAHDRNRTDDLLLTMEMLYRLSYVGRQHSTHHSGQHCTMKSSRQVYRPVWEGWLERGASKRRHTTPRRRPRIGSRRGEARDGESRDPRPLVSTQNYKKEGVAAIRVKSFTRAKRPRTGLERLPTACAHLAKSPEPTLAAAFTGRRWSGKRDSNPRPSAWKADALAAELFPLKIKACKVQMVVGEGFEPSKA